VFKGIYISISFRQKQVIRIAFLGCFTFYDGPPHTYTVPGGTSSLFTSKDLLFEEMCQKNNG